MSAYQIWLNAGNTGTEAQFLTSLQGTTGPIGLTGPVGPQGLQGIQGLTGPTGATGSQGPIGLTGATGTTGTTGAQGPAGTNGTNGSNGLSAYQIWLNAGNTGTEAQFLTNLQGTIGPQGIQGVTGPTGATGPQGPAGPTGTAVLNGTNTPTSSTGVNGDFYINTTTNTLYGPKANGAWPTGTSLVGPTGATGAQGTAGTNGLSAYQIWLNAGNTGNETDFINYLSSNIPNGTNINQLLYWSGTNWNILNPGTDNQILSIQNGTLSWQNIQSISSSLLPVVHTLNVNYDYNNYIFTINSNLSPGASANNVGIAWSLFPNPTINNNYVSFGTITPGNNFSTTLNISQSIFPNTTYYFRSYASNNNGISYGQELSFTTGQFLIGQFYQGGIIVYINNSGEHGIIASQNTNATSLWGCSGTAVGAVGTTIGTGLQNTNAILSGCSQTNCAARICDNLILNGYSDWYLPSLDELYRIYICRQFLNYSSGNESSHWSSSEYGNPGYSNAYYVVLSTGGIGNLPKNYSTLPISVRAVRSF